MEIICIVCRIAATWGMYCVQTQHDVLFCAILFMLCRPLLIHRNGIFVMICCFLLLNRSDIFIFLSNNQIDYPAFLCRMSSVVFRNAQWPEDSQGYPMPTMSCMVLICSQKCVADDILNPQITVDRPIWLSSLRGKLHAHVGAIEALRHVAALMPSKFGWRDAGCTGEKT